MNDAFAIYTRLNIQPLAFFGNSFRACYLVIVVHMGNSDLHRVTVSAVLFISQMLQQTCMDLWPQCAKSAALCTVPVCHVHFCVGLQHAAARHPLLEHMKHARGEGCIPDPTLYGRSRPSTGQYKKNSFLSVPTLYLLPLIILFSGYTLWVARRPKTALLYPSPGTSARNPGLHTSQQQPYRKIVGKI